jgi:hypothetical protein
VTTVSVFPSDDIFFAFAFLMAMDAVIDSEPYIYKPLVRRYVSELSNLKKHEGLGSSQGC